RPSFLRRTVPSPLLRFLPTVSAPLQRCLSGMFPRSPPHVSAYPRWCGCWQASGESLKTSIRTKTRLGQIVQEGRFRGGTPAYGFRLVKKGRLGKKNRELYDIEINPEEAIAVKRMFDLTDRYGYGGRKISTVLKSEGIV